MKNRKVVIFLGITYILTMVFHLMLQLYGGKSNPAIMGALGIPMVFPFVAVVVVQKWIYKEKLSQSLGISIRLNLWWSAAILMPIAMWLLINVLGAAIFKREALIAQNLIKVLGINLLLGLSIATISALFEEFGWRGFLYEELKPLGVVKSFVITGVAWAVWHIPVIAWYKYPTAAFLGILLNSIQLFVLSLLISYIRWKAGSVIAAAVIHGVLNTLVLSTSAMAFNGADTLALEGVGALVGLLMLFAILLYERRLNKEIFRPKCLETKGDLK